LLRLVTAKFANSLGIPAEAPTFISPYIGGPERCDLCSVTFTPLVYQTGRVTYAQHYHPGEGGIYFSIATREEWLAWLTGGEGIGPTGFVAHIEPIGQVETIPDTQISADWLLQDSFLDETGYLDYIETGSGLEGMEVRAEAALIMHITAYCAHQNHTPCPVNRLTEGILVERRVNASPCDPPEEFDSKPGDLVPLCGPDELWEWEHAAFSFQVRDGTVYFRRHRPRMQRTDRVRSVVSGSQSNLLLPQLSGNRQQRQYLVRQTRSRPGRTGQTASSSSTSKQVSAA
jgi:hypothetical protein